jgi:putative SOS response-associated peptidase YedK
MCGRFSLTLDYIPKGHFDTAEPRRLQPDNDIRPLTPRSVVVQGNDGPQWAELKWGIEKKDCDWVLVNALTVAMAQNPQLRQAFASRRCLIPLDGWYEWRYRERFFFRIPEMPLFAMAGLWFDQEEPCFVSFTIPATALSLDISAFMPVLVQPEDYATWLSGQACQAGSLLKPYAGPLEIISTPGAFEAA